MPSTIKDILDEFKKHHSFDSAKVSEQTYQFAEKSKKKKKRKNILFMFALSKIKIRALGQAD